MTPLLLALALLQDPGAWKTKSVTIIVQHSGAHRNAAPTVSGLLTRLLAVRPPTTAIEIVGFERDFKQVENGRFKRKPEIVQQRTTDADALQEAVATFVFNGPSPIWDSIVATLDGDKPERILLLSNGIDNASQTSFDDMMTAAGKANVPITTLYLSSDPPAGGDSRLKKLAKATNGRFIDVRLKDSWEQLMGALR
jgi:hypothetical protein